MTNHIFLHGLKLNTKIGVPDWERAILQELIIDVDIELKGNETFKSNDISKTIDYALIEAQIKEIGLRNKNKLLEDFGEEIICKLKEKFQFEKIRLKISKQKILPETDFVGVILER
ncbi:MAG: dihydroneopterin aldolase [Methylophilaceae bacterium]|tara:strand:- start:30 stop:377 length:348 start_codon:yes stop_codon:yes gene_type:complete